MLGVPFRHPSRIRHTKVSCRASAMMRCLISMVMMNNALNPSACLLRLQWKKKTRPGVGSDLQRSDHLERSVGYCCWDSASNSPPFPSPKHPHSNSSNNSTPYVQRQGVAWTQQRSRGGEQAARPGFRSDRTHLNAYPGTAEAPTTPASQAPATSGMRYHHLPPSTTRRGPLASAAGTGLLLLVLAVAGTSSGVAIRALQAPSTMGPPPNQSAFELLGAV